MFHAVHAASANMATALRQVLAYTHAQKRQRGVDSMLLRLYEPILWRALKVANPHVRRNAATLLIEAFPLQDPTLPLTQLDEALQRQFDALAALLKDDSVPVRVVAVQGVCRILALFWARPPPPHPSTAAERPSSSSSPLAAPHRLALTLTGGATRLAAQLLTAGSSSPRAAPRVPQELIPSATSTPLLLLLTKELAHDAAANSVRVAVFQGLRFLLANNGSAACLATLKGSAASKSPLAPLAPLLHDSSQRVRRAMLDLLIELSKALPPRPRPRPIQLRPLAYRPSASPNAPAPSTPFPCFPRCAASPGRRSRVPRRC